LQRIAIDYRTVVEAGKDLGRPTPTRGTTDLVNINTPTRGKRGGRMASGVRRKDRGVDSRSVQS